MNMAWKLKSTNKIYSMAENTPIMEAKMNLVFTKYKTLNEIFYIHYLIHSSQ